MSLTKKQKAVLDYIKDYIHQHGISPTQNEIKDFFQLKSLGSVQDYLQYLSNAGEIQLDYHGTRSISVLEKTSDSSIHLFGFVSAGKPIEAIAGNQLIEVPPHLLNGSGPFFALRVKGESMIDDGIHDHDVIIAKAQQHAEKGQVVIAEVEGGATVKYYYPKGEMVELRPANSQMATFHYPADQVQIKGILCGLMRSYS